MVKDLAGQTKLFSTNSKTKWD